MVSSHSFQKYIPHVLLLGIIISCLILPTTINAQDQGPATPQTNTQAPGDSRSSTAGSAGCPGGWRNWTKPIDCFLVPMVVAAFGGIVMGASGMVLEFAGYLFDLLVNTFVVAFATTLASLGMIDGIHTGWTVLRDISNIVIIGMFTFIAISIIIGNHTFGEKRLVAKVLIVAVLINFSLLFAKIIIDTSNFFAWQVYKNMAPPGSGNNTVRNLTLGTGTGANISGKFLSLLKTTSIWDVTANSIQANAQGGYSLSDHLGWNTLKGAAKGVFFAIVASILLLVAAGVLLYGCYLIAVRGLLLVFLMLVSALAFASYLVPNLSDGEYGWKTWWKSLLNASIFGPLLMILLYVNLVILTPIHAKVQGGSFANVLANPSTLQQAGNDWQVIIVFIFGIGMLFASLKVANSFAGKIAGFSTASMLTGAPIIGAARLSGLVGRSSIGRWSAGKHSELAAKEHKSFADQVALRGLNLMKKGTFDFTKQAGMAAALSKLNAPKFGDSWGKGGYAGVKKRQTEHAVHVAAENSESQAAATKRGETEGKEAQIRKLEADRDALRKKIDEREQGLAADRQVATNEARKAPVTARKTPTTEEVARNAEAEHAASETRDRQHIQGEGAARIERARNLAAERAVQQSLETADSLDSLKKQAEELEKALGHLKGGELTKLAPEYRNAIREAGERAKHAAHHAEQQFAESVAKFTPGMLFGDKRAVKGVEEGLKSHAKSKEMEGWVKELGKVLESKKKGDHGGGDDHGEKKTASPAAAKPAADPHH